MPSKPRWTLEDEIALRALYRRRSIDWLEAYLKRSRSSIRSKANRLKISETKQTFSLRNLIESTGYNWKQILKAKKELNQTWKRIGSDNGPYAITEEQKSQLLAHLAKPGPKYSVKPGRKPNNFWAPTLQLTKCLNCQHTKHKHQGIGLCIKCYHHIRQKPQRFHFYKTLITYWKLTNKFNLPTNTQHPIDQIRSLPNNFTTVTYPTIIVN
jgi:5-bromo-4-chloroindolyl phosphate hydrolysis protein